jgi:SAM-dependent methyltransferase
VSFRLRDLAGRDHWEGVWERHRPARVSALNYYHARLDALLAPLVRPGARVLEVGCGGSRWLPHLARRHGCEVWGVDYSAEGLRLARANLALAGVAAGAQLVEADFFEESRLPAGAFDLVYSLGFLEHFDDPGPAVARMRALLRPGGHALALVPNLEGVVGWLHRAADRAVFAKHVVVPPRALDAMHAAEGFAVAQPAAHVGVFGLTVVNAERLRRRLPRPVDALLWGGAHAVQQAICLGPRLAGRAPESRAFSPWIVGVYRMGGLEGPPKPPALRPPAEPASSASAGEGPLKPASAGA